MNYREPIVLEPKSGEAKAAIIWLHGLGADGGDFVPIVPELNIQDAFGIRFIFPHAPIQAVTVNNGYEMPAWYDIYSTSVQQKIDHAGIAKSVAYLNKLVDEQVNSGIPLNRLILAGFSQGGVIALDCALRMENKPVGVMALSTYLAEEVATGKGLNIFQAHGLQDDVIPIEGAHLSAQALTRLGAEVASHDYPMAHSVCAQEIVDMAVWLGERLG